MKKQNFAYIPKILIWTAVIAFLDQLTKYFAVKFLASTTIFIPGFFSFQYAENTGIAFSLSLPYLSIIILTSILLIIVFFLATKELNLDAKLSQFSLAMIMGGGLGNLVDRLVNGYVVDFISIWRWPLFNLADIVIVVGILLIVFFYGKVKKV